MDLKLSLDYFNVDRYMFKKIHIYNELNTKFIKENMTIVTTKKTQKDRKQLNLKQKKYNIIYDLKVKKIISILNYNSRVFSVIYTM